jgi:uncharacterized RDD family membrane protein YckC
VNLNIDKESNTHFQGVGRPAGFWIRFAALWLDFLLIWASVEGAVTILRSWGVYVPREAAWLLLGVVYFVAMTTWRGATIGKIICGLRVFRKDGQSPGLIRVVVRETVAKVVSVIPLFLGFLRAGWGKKLAWHDRLSGTCVTLLSSMARRRTIVAIVLVANTLALGWYLWEPVQSIRATLAMSVPADLVLPCDVRDPSLLVEVASLKPEDETQFAQWLNDHGRTPLDYVVEKVSEHQVVLLGEMHEQGDTLRWLNEAIPVLRERAGITCVAMEVCNATDNPAIQRLVTAEKFDRNLAAEIARHQYWGMWGWKEYWDVLETVWRVNRAMPSDQQRLRLIGLDKSMDALSLMALGIEGPATDVPFWEKLQVWKAPRLIALMMLRDGAMAQEVEREVFDKGERAVVLVGAAHAAVAYRHPIGCSHPQPGRNELAQMGLLLHQRHPDQVFQIRLHQRDLPASLMDKNYRGPAPAMAAFLERVMANRDHAPVGFDVTGSPMAMLRDSGVLEYYGQPTVGFGDVAAGYVYLKDWRKNQHCSWQTGYITAEMFTANKPLYQAIARAGGKNVSNAAEMNEFFATMK